MPQSGTWLPRRGRQRAHPAADRDGRATIRVTMDPDDATQPAYEVRPVTVPRRSSVRPALALGLAAILIGLVVVKPWGWLAEPRSPAVAVAPIVDSTPPVAPDPTAAITPDPPIPTTPGWPALAQAGDPLGDPGARLPLTSRIARPSLGDVGRRGCRRRATDRTRGAVGRLGAGQAGGGDR